MKNATSTALAAILLSLMSANAPAAPVTYDFSGAFTTSGQTSPFLLELPAGLDPSSGGNISFTGWMTIDHEAPDVRPADSTFGYYPGALLNFSMQVNGLDFTFDPLNATPGATSSAYVRNDDAVYGGYTYNDVNVDISAFQPAWLASLGSGQQLASIWLNHGTDDVTEIASDALPSSLDSFEPWTLTLFVYENDEYGDATQSFQTSGVANLTRRPGVAVPESSSLVLMALGLAAMGLRRKVWKAAAVKGTAAA
jgi:hypothetical protein